ncbi:MAG: hypothetical protein HDR82_09800 [Bacteroides sp.]|nr:hypothetical protein [Bacteroides sp.]
MSEKEIKVGDRVRFKKFCINYDDEVRVAEGDYGEVVSVDKNRICVDLDEPQSISVWVTDVELAEPIDSKTAFLTELSELLRKYDAEFSDYENYEVIFNLGDKVSISIDTSNLFNWTNADNLLERATFSEEK